MRSRLLTAVALMPQKRQALRSILLAALAINVTIAHQVGGGGPGQSQVVPSGPPGVPAPRGTAAISGVVIDAATKRPIPGAAVSLGMDRPVTGTLRPPPLQQMLTDDKGRFVFWRLAAGDGYFVNVTAIGYFDGGYGRTPSSGTARRIALVERQWFEHADIEMWRPGAVSGRVLDEHGDPVVNVPVRVMRHVYVAGRTQIASGPNVNTDDRGAFRIGGLTPGRYFVVVPSIQMTAPVTTLAALAAKRGPPSPVSPSTTTDVTLDVDGVNRLAIGRFPTPPFSADGRMMAYPVAWYPGTSTMSSSTPVDLDYGADRSGLDVRLQPVPASRISGVVQGPPDVISNLTLRLITAGSESLGLGSEAATALVAADGSFTFLNVPAGDYTIDARGTITEYEFNAGSARYNLPQPPGTRSIAGWAMDVPSGTPGTGMTTMTFGANTHWGRLAVTVGERDLTNAIVTLQPTVTLSGRIVYDGESPPPQTRFILAEPADGNASLGQPRSSNFSGDSLVFALLGLLPGEYFVRIRAGEWIVKSITAGSRDYTDTPFDASAGRDFSDVVVTLADKPAAIEGSVTAADGQPAPRGIVIAFPADSHQWSNYGLSPQRIKAGQLTNVSRYRITGLPAGDYVVVAVDESLADAWHDPAFLAAALSAATRVTVAWGQTAVQNLRIAAVQWR